MADYAPSAIDLRDVSSLLGANPARDYFYAGIARRRPELLSGFAGAQDRKLNDLVDRAYAQTDDVNAMLNELAQQDLYNAGRKEDLGFLGKVISGQSSDGYRAGIGPTAAAAGFEGLGDILGQYNMIGDESALNVNDATAYNKRKSADAAMVSAQAANQRAAQGGRPKSRLTYDPITKKYTPTWDFMGNQTMDEMLSQINGDTDPLITDPASLGGDPFSTEGTGVDITPAGTAQDIVRQNVETVKADMAGQGKTFVKEQPGIKIQNGDVYTGIQFNDGSWVFINEADGSVVVSDE